MSSIEGLIEAYRRFVRHDPWDRSLAGPQRVWFAIYDPPQERRLRLRLDLFAAATQDAGRGWHLVDITDSFAHWMAQNEYREQYFAQPELMELALGEYTQVVIDQLRAVLGGPEVDDNAVVALLGVASLFGLTRTSAVLDAVAPAIRGRLLVFFPGQRDGSNYRLLDARDGWNYLAQPIEATEGI